MKEYDPKEIESKWQREWEQSGIYSTADKVGGKKNEYVLVEFAYPSGNLHVGHWYAFSVPDIYARYRRMSGKNVMYPMGFDAFGLPAENAAIKNKLNPREWTFSNIDYMRKQLHSMGASFDWSREVITASPEYYKWTQWLFLKFLENGLAYRAETPANWCPSCKTVLANEQVVNDHCERCGTLVEKRNMLQWNIRITNYADRLISDLESLDWPNSIKESQRNWIGRSEGALIKFDDIEVFTTRPDTIFGATFIVIAGKEDKFTGRYVTNPATGEKIPVWEAEYVLSDYGTGAIMAVPAHDERDREFALKHNLPVKEVGVPNIIDKRNPPVAGKKFVERNSVHPIVRNPKTGKYLALKWKKFDWVTFPMGGIDDGEDVIEAAKREVQEETGYKNLKLVKVIEGRTRAEYFAAHKDENRVSWTTAVVFDLVDDDREEVSEKEKESFDVIWLDRSELNYDHMTHAESNIWDSRLDKEYSVFSDKGVVVNSGEFDGLSSDEAREKITEKFGKKVTKYKLRDWGVSRQRYWGCPIPVIHCSKCGILPVPAADLPVVLPETDDYLPNDEGQSPLSKVESWVNVLCPKCGEAAKRETDTLDTFVDSSWYFLRYTDPKNFEEFASKEKQKLWMPVNFYSGGAEHTTMHLLYSRFFHKALFDMGLVNEHEPYIKRMNRGLIMGPDGQKMSKSRGNVIDPDKEVSRLGADTVRTYMAFIGPYNEVGAYPWNPDAAVGVRRFLERVWKLKEKINEGGASISFDPLIQKVSKEIESMKMNTAVSSLMVMVNQLNKSETVSRKNYETLLQLLAPFAPHMAEELWASLGYSTSIHQSQWPTYDESKLQADEVVIMVQVNGKVRGRFETKAGIGELEAFKQAELLPEVQKWVVDKVVKNRIYVPNKLVNIVTIDIA